MRQLVECIKQETRLDTPNENGKTRRKDLVAFREVFRKRGASKEQLDKQFSELEPLEKPYGFEYIYDSFRELSISRGWGAMGGPLPITYLEIKAYMDVTGQAFDAYEVEMIRTLDAAFLTEYAKITERTGGENDARRITDTNTS